MTALGIAHRLGEASPSATSRDGVAEPGAAASESPQPSPLRLMLKTLGENLRRLGVRAVISPKRRRMRVAETLSLGDKRFLSIVEVDGRALLIGGGSTDVSLLTILEDSRPEQSFAGSLENAWRTRESA